MFVSFFFLICFFILGAPQFLGPRYEMSENQEYRILESTIAKIT
jgi:hypothetical protein